MSHKREEDNQNTDPVLKLESPEEIGKYIKMQELEMKQAAKQLEFERAAVIRDEVTKLKRMILKI